MSGIILCFPNGLYSVNIQIFILRLITYSVKDQTENAKGKLNIEYSGKVILSAIRPGNQRTIW